MNELEELKRLCGDFRALYAEDEERLRSKVAVYLSRFFKSVDVASSGEDALLMYKKNGYDIVLSDISMPKLDGISMAQEMKKIDANQKIIIISGYSDSEKFIKTIKMGIDGYILKPFNYKQMNEVIRKSALSLKESRENEIYKSRLLELVQSKVKKIEELEIEKTKEYKEALYTLVDLIEQRDPYTGGHSSRVAEYCKLIAKELDMPDEETDILYEAGILHDIGKIAIPDSILLKPGKFDELEYSIIKKHVDIGYNILKKYHIFAKISKIIKTHHERIDGSGYPEGLKGDEISLEGKIMGVADSFDAMTTSRIYQARKSVKEALEEIDSLKGIRFDERVVKAAKKSLSEVKIETNATQLPQNEMEKERFSYFYRDQLTGAYNKSYLDLVLSKNRFSSEYKTADMLFLKDFTSFNKKNGWSIGDMLLKKVASKSKKCSIYGMVFRVYGDDFAVIGSEKFAFEGVVELCEENGIKCEHIRVDLQKNSIISLDSLSQYLRELEGI